MEKIRETIKSTTPPNENNVIWIDVSTDEPIQKVFLNGEWKPLKDSDAEFATGQKVSEISLATGNPAPASVTIPTTIETKSISPATGETSVNIETKSGVNWEVTSADTINIINTLTTETDLVTTIIFTSTNTPTTLTYPNTLKWINDEIPEIENGAEYLIAIWNNIAVINKIATIPQS